MSDYTDEISSDFGIWQAEIIGDAFKLLESNTTQELVIQAREINNNGDIGDWGKKMLNAYSQHSYLSHKQKLVLARAIAEFKSLHPQA